MATHSSILDWEIHGQRSLASYRPWGHKESDTTELLTHTCPSKSPNTSHLEDIVPCDAMLGQCWNLEPATGICFGSYRSKKGV